MEIETKAIGKLAKEFKVDPETKIIGNKIIVANSSVYW